MCEEIDFVCSISIFISFIFFLQTNSVANECHAINPNSLRMMFELHNRLMDLAQNINKCYACVLLNFVTGIFVFSIFGLFFETKVLFWSWEKSTKLILISTSPVLWVIAGLANVYVLLSVCESARSAAYEMPLIVHKIMQMKPQFMLRDDVYYNKMKAFTIQMLHRKKTFNFSALGLFNFDYTFIFSVRKWKLYSQNTTMNDKIDNCFFFFFFFRLNSIVGGERGNVLFDCFATI